MSEETPPAAPEPTAPEPEPEPTPEPEPQTQAVPYDRFKEVNDQLKAEREQREALEAAAREREEAELSEIEKANKRAEEAEAARAEAESKATNLERSGWVRDQAAKLDFTNPGDAVDLLERKFGEIEDPAAAEKAVKQLADERPHLLGQGKPTPIGAPLRGNDDDGGEDDPKLGLGRELAGRLLGQ